MFSGCLTALVTPFHNQNIDETALRRLVQHQIHNKVSGIVPLGTTGESPTITDAEYECIIKIVVEEVAGQIPVIAGAGSNNPVHALHLARRAQDLGADGVLAVAGYYNRPSQEGLFAHFKMLHDNTDIPIVIYNIPPRTIVDISPDTMARLAQLPRVVGVKDATGDFCRISDEQCVIKKDFAYLSGDDSSALAYRVLGGKGCISVLSNILPAQLVAFHQACNRGDYQQALTLHNRLYPLIQALFIEPNPVGIKYALSLLNLCHEECRLPLLPLQNATKVQIRYELEQLQVIES